jgi:hypothetical protein
MSNKYLGMHASWLALGLVPFAIACGSGGGSDGSGNGVGNAPGGAVTVVGDGKAFVPDGIAYSIVDGGRALTLLSATVISDSTGMYWFIAVRNDEAEPICAPQVNAAFTDAADPSNSLGGDAIVIVQGLMYQSDVGAQRCLLPGATGMGWQLVSGFTSTTPQIVAVDYQPRGYLTPSVMKLPDLAVESVTIGNDPAGGKLVSGSVANHGTSTVSHPLINVFAVDSGGRPFDGGNAGSMSDLAPGNSWSFQITGPTPFNKYVAVPAWGEY